MQKPKLVVFSQEFSNCPCFQNIFTSEFTAVFSFTKKQFLNRIISYKPDISVVCICSGRKKDAEELLQLNALSGPIPLLACSKILTLDFVSAATHFGVNYFLCCRWKKERIEDIIFEAIQHGSIKFFIETHYLENFASSPHIHKEVDEIVHAFPDRMNENQIAERLGISVSWLQKLNRKTFNLNFHRLIRRIWINQSLCMMKHTNLNNSEIALRLNYSEESSMARDFRKELGLSPTEARKRLTNHTPEELFY